MQLYQEYRTCPGCNTFLSELQVEERTRICDEVKTIHHLIWTGPCNARNITECVCPECSLVFHTCHLHVLKRNAGQKNDCELNCWGNSYDDIDYALDFRYDEESKYVEETVWEYNGSSANFTAEQLIQMEQATPIPDSTEQELRYTMSADNSYLLVFWIKNTADLNTLDERWRFKQIQLPIEPAVLNFCMNFSQQNPFRRVNELQTYVQYTVRNYT